MKRLSGQATRMRAAKREKSTCAVDLNDGSFTVDVASASIDTGAATSSLEASVEGSMETVDMAEDSISYVSSEIAPDLQQSRIQQLIEDAALFESDADEEATEDPDDSQTVFDDWMLTLMKHQRKMLAVLLYCSFQKGQKMSKMSAAQESASITGELLLFIVKLYTCSLFRNYFIFAGYHERTVRAYAKEFFDNDMKFNDAQQGKYERQCVLSDEELRSQASLWVRENALRRVSPT